MEDGSARWVATETDTRFIVRNFSNTKGFWFRPTRSWKNSGERLSNQLVKQTRKSRGNNKTKPNKEKQKSKKFMKDIISMHPS